MSRRRSDDAVPCRKDRRNLSGERQAASLYCFRKDRRRCHMCGSIPRSFPGHEKRSPAIPAGLLLLFNFFDLSIYIFFPLRRQIEIAALSSLYPFLLNEVFFYPFLDRFYSIWRFYLIPRFLYPFVLSGTAGSQVLLNPSIILMPVFFFTSHPDCAISGMIVLLLSRFFPFERVFCFFEITNKYRRPRYGSYCRSAACADTLPVSSMTFFTAFAPGVPRDGLTCGNR